MNVSELLGKTMTDVERRKTEDDGDEIVFITTEDKSYRLYHYQECCESVTIEDIVGDLSDLVGSPILMSEEVSSTDSDELRKSSCGDSCTWTFYKFATVKGYVTIRWFGSSNGYYSEGVDFEEVH